MRLTYALYVLVLAVLGALAVTLAISQQVVSTDPPRGIACAYNASPPTITTGNAGWVQCDINGKLLTSAAASGTTAITQASPSIGAATFTPGQWSNATASATQIVAARTGVAGTGRVSITLYNSGTTTFFYGPSGVTTATGTRLLPGGSRTIATTAAIFGVPASGTSTCDYDETY